MEKTTRIGRFKLYLSKDVYIPGEDTFLLEDILRNQIKMKPELCCDLGCGSGYLSLVLKELYPNCTLYSVDINSSALEITEKNLELNSMNKNTYVIKSYLFRNLGKKFLKNPKFDLLIFNPPYLPEDLYETKDLIDEALLGGNKTGDRIIIEFLESLVINKKKFFHKTSKIILLISSWNKEAKNFIERNKDLKIESKIKSKYSFETLTCFVLSIY
ncbi:MAG: methyltransferase [Candidatus Thorarchaeota archaeon]